MFKYLFLFVILLPLFNFSPSQQATILKDQCPEPAQENWQNWSCGNWQLDHGELRRVFHLFINESTTLDIGDNREVKNLWTFNNTIPAPTLRMTEGDPVTIYVHNPSSSKLPHSLHMHSIHPSIFDGAGHDMKIHEIPVNSIGQYIFTAQPSGFYPFHCHIHPVDIHIVQGLIGSMIIDPKEPREKANEIIIMSSSFDLVKDNDYDPEYYVYNGKIDQYADKPIPVKLGELNRIYFANMAEYRDTISFHVHGLMFNYWQSGTNSSFVYNDIITLSQGDRGILEFKTFYPNTFMFHSHQNDVMEKGQLGFFSVVR